MENLKSQNEQSQTTVSRLRGKYLTFVLGKEEYGVAILKVKEIIRIMEITRIPNSIACAKGVINLRGKVIPIIDLRLKFEMDPHDYDDRTCIIVVEVTSDKRCLSIGIVVDSVSEVISLSDHEIEPPPDFGIVTSQANILGVAKINKKVKILLDIDRVLTRKELDSFHHEAEI